MDAARLACLAALAACALSGGALAPGALIAVLASTAALVAARERRHRDMALAAGIAAGASSAGLALLPVLLGTAIARRVAGATTLAFLPAAAATALAVGWTPATDASLFSVAPSALLILLPATAIGAGAWIAASCAARSPRPGELDGAALLACLALPSLAPVGIETAGLAVALAVGGVPLTLRPLVRATNDDPLPIRPLPVRPLPVRPLPA